MHTTQSPVTTQIEYGTRLPTNQYSRTATSNNNQMHQQPAKHVHSQSPLRRTRCTRHHKYPPEQLIWHRRNQNPVSMMIWHHHCWQKWKKSGKKRRSPNSSTIQTHINTSCVNQTLPTENNRFSILSTYTWTIPSKQYRMNRHLHEYLYLKSLRYSN